MTTLTYDQLKAEIERYGVHPTFGGSGELDAGIEQNPDELAHFLTIMQAIGVQSVLEIGTGYKGGLSRFLAAVMGWHVTTVDTQVYGHKFEGVHYIYAPEGKADLGEGQWEFDLVLIDANPSYLGTKANWEYYSGYAHKAIALHDIAGLRDCEGVAAFWYDMAYQGDEELDAGFYEAIADSEQRGGYRMAAALKEGDYVRWVTDVNKVYSRDTKTLVGKVGEIVQPHSMPQEKVYDVMFLYKGGRFTVWDIKESELVKVDAP